MFIELGHYFLIISSLSIILTFFYDFYYNFLNHPIKIKIKNKYIKNIIIFFIFLINKILNYNIFKILVKNLINFYKLIINLNLLPKKNNNFYKLEPIYFINIFYYSIILVFITIILFCYAYIISDFSIINIALNSNVLEAIFYKICGFWGNKEGSTVLWVLILYIYNLLFILNLNFYKFKFNFKISNMQSYTLFFFLIFLINFTNPFIKNNIFIFNGKELNPILQDPTLIIHPPFLYMGYLGFSLLFIIAFFILREKNTYLYFFEYLKYFNILSWLTLTFGIGLGSWWAYYELGWGGWWFWDPVENISLIPWLFSLSILHFFILNEKSNLFFNWSLNLILSIYIIIIFSSFIVRSGLLLSVHSFAQDLYSSILIFIYLIFIFIFIFIFYKQFYKKIISYYIDIFSKENIIKFNNIIIMLSGVLILFTIFIPLLINLFYKEKIDLGNNFYNQIFIPIILPFIISISIIPFSPWNKNFKLNYILNLEFLFSFIFLFIYLNNKYLYYFYNSILNIITLLIFIYLFIFLLKLKKINGMILTHLGFILFILSITINLNFQSNFIGIIFPGDVLHLNDYIIIFRNLHEFGFNNNITYLFDFVLKLNNDLYNIIFNEQIFFYFKEFLNIKSNINSTLFKDLYIILGDGGINSGWYIKLIINPFINYLWLSFIIIILGAI